MALKTCFQASTIAPTSTAAAGACFLPGRRPFSHKEKLNLPTCKEGPRRTAASFSTTSPSSSSSSTSPSTFVTPPVVGRRDRGGRLICEAKNIVDEVLVVNDASWSNLVVGSETPVLVEFWAPWCGPCRMIAPVIDELAKEYAGKIACFKLNTDDSPNIASQYGIRSIPTVLFFKNGEKKESVIGAVPKTALIATIEKYLG